MTVKDTRTLAEEIDPADDTATCKMKPDIDPAIQRRIGHKLREAWEQIVSEPVPSRFQDLLENLKKASSEPPPKGKKFE